MYVNMQDHATESAARQIVSHSRGPTSTTKKRLPVDVFRALLVIGKPGLVDHMQAIHLLHVPDLGGAIVGKRSEQGRVSQDTYPAQISLCMCVFVRVYRFVCMWQQTFIENRCRLFTPQQPYLSSLQERDDATLNCLLTTKLSVLSLWLSKDDRGCDLNQHRK